MINISVVIADPRKATRTSYSKQLHPEKGIQVVAEVGTEREMVEALKLRPRILLLDGRMFGLSEVPLLPLIRRYSPQTKVILLTGRIGPLRLVHALAGGVRGYLERALARSVLAKAVRMVDKGEVWVSRAVVPLLVSVLSRITLP
ncbi:MAG: response regulator [Nitrospiraceae bacterium]